MLNALELNSIELGNSSPSDATYMAGSTTITCTCTEGFYKIAQLSFDQTVSVAGSVSGVVTQYLEAICSIAVTTAITVGSYIVRYFSQNETMSVTMEGVLAAIRNTVISETMAVTGVYDYHVERPLAGATTCTVTSSFTPLVVSIFAIPDQYMTIPYENRTMVVTA